MPAPAFAAIAALEVVFFGKALVAFGRIIKIFAFDGFIFVILVVHNHYKNNKIRPNVFDCFQIFAPQRI